MTRMIMIPTQSRTRSHVIAFVQCTVTVTVPDSGLEPPKAPPRLRLRPGVPHSLRPLSLTDSDLA